MYTCIITIIIITVLIVMYMICASDRKGFSVEDGVIKSIERGDPPPMLLSKGSFMMDHTISNNSSDLLIEGPAIIFNTIDLSKNDIKNIKNSKRKFIIVKDADDTIFPDEVSNSDIILNCRNCIHIFSANARTTDKTTSIPIGLPLYLTCAIHPAKEQENELLNYYHNGPNIKDRKLVCIAGWRVDTSNRKYGNIFRDFINKFTGKSLIQRGYVKEGRFAYTKRFQKDIIEWEDSGNRDKLWEAYSQSAFAISPAGNGIDCFRTWEALCLGCIVIVQDTLLNPLYEGMPVIITDNPETLTKEVLQDYVDKLGWMCHDPETRKKYTYQYWKDKIVDNLNQNTSTSVHRTE